MPESPSLHREHDPRRRLVLALDFPRADPAWRLLEELGDDLRWVKVGMELFTAEGPELVRTLVESGRRVFLDLKFHDIPNTMAGGVRSAAELGASLCTVHASAGAGVAAAAAAAREARASGQGQELAVLAVTVLTSHAESDPQSIFGSPLGASELVPHLGKQAIAAGADGLVASPREIESLREAVGPRPLLVIPGIRPAGAAVDDQNRTATPTAALRSGADLLVVGRPITQARDPRAALGRILDEMAGAV
jgi:orotidine-5'-phosphate decarboxylase